MTAAFLTDTQIKEAFTCFTSGQWDNSQGAMDPDELRLAMKGLGFGELTVEECASMIAASHEQQLQQQQLQNTTPAADTGSYQNAPHDGNTNGTSQRGDDTNVQNANHGDSDAGQLDVQNSGGVGDNSASQHAGGGGNGDETEYQHLFLDRDHAANISGMPPSEEASETGYSHLIVFSEFERLIKSKMAQRGSTDELQNVFHLLDRDGSGKISLTDLLQVIEMLHEHKSLLEQYQEGQRKARMERIEMKKQREAERNQRDGHDTDYDDKINDDVDDEGDSALVQSLNEEFIRPSVETLRSMMKAADVGNDGEVDFPEFCRIIAANKVRYKHWHSNYTHLM